MKAQIIIRMDRFVLNVSILSIGIILILNVNIVLINKSTILILDAANTVPNKTLISMASTVQFVQITNSITPFCINANLVSKEKFITRLKWFVNVPRLTLSRQLKVVCHATGQTIFLSPIRHVYLVKKTIYLVKRTENASHVHMIRLFLTKPSVSLVLIIHSLTPC